VSVFYEFYPQKKMETAALPYIPVRRAYETHLYDVDWDNLEMGRYTSDHMLVCDFAGGSWQQPEIIPFSSFSLPPTSLVFHYGQAIFEGMKAFRTENDAIHIFRPDKHYERFARTAERLCMPVLPADLFREGLRRLVELEQNWVPGQPGGALYIRPFQIATDTKLSVKVSDAYKFAVICSPAGAYFARPVRVKVERQYTRAAKGGTGYAKCSGNYGGALYPTAIAKSEGYDQVLWTDGRNHEYIEESGMMNVFFVIGDTVVTPPLSDSILDGVTRDCLLTLAADRGMKVEERPVSVKELEHVLETKEISEAFGAGTAAVVSPIRCIGIDDHDHNLPLAGEPGSVAITLKNALDDIRYGRTTDRYGWNYFI
jgi:branched-chain amino acid aminotransferase